MDLITAQISAFAATLTFADLGAKGVHAAKQHFVDALGCAYGAHDCEPARIGRRLGVGQSPGLYPGRVLFTGETLPAEAAAFINAAMIRNLDFNDRYPGGHPSDCVGALLALAGAMPCDGRAFLTGMTVAYEIFARLCDAAQLSRRGWDQGYGVAISTAAGLCNLLGLSQRETAHAVGIAAVSGLPLRVTRSGELTSWKNVATAHAARNGVFAALLAKEGMQGPGNAFEGRDGLWQNVTGAFEIEAFANAGGPTLLPRVQLKYWPLEMNGQPAVWAALDMRDAVAIADIAAIELFTSEPSWREIGSEPEKWDPQTRETADHSLPYIFARALIDGPLTLASFRMEAVRDPALRPLMAKIKVTVDDAIDALLPTMRLRVVATMKDGTQHTVEVGNPIGHPDNPMQDKDVNEKFRVLAEPVIGAARAHAARAALWDIDRAGDVGQLMALLNMR